MANLGGSSNSAIAFDFFINKGLTCEQAAAIVGNLYVESNGVNPASAVMDSNKKMSRGIASWQPDRWQNLITFAAGRNPLSLDVQLEFLWSELPSQGLSQLTSATSLEDAVVAFQNRFERPKKGYEHTDRRIAAAQAALYACPSVKPPDPKNRGITVIATVGIVALVAAAGYGVYKAFSGRERTPEPLPPPRPVFRPPVYRPMPPPPVYRGPF
jgi:hypothetical protein